MARHRRPLGDRPGTAVSLLYGFEPGRAGRDELVIQVFVRADRTGQVPRVDHVVGEQLKRVLSAGEITERQVDDLVHRTIDAGAWALPLRQAGAQLVQDLHPHDRGPKGTHEGAVIANGNLYCPATPRTLTELGPLARTAAKEQAADHDRKTSELARYKLGRITADDADGYHRVQCPAAMRKVRCPLRPASMLLDRDRPEILLPPEHPQACCAQQTITVPPDVLAKTAQKHDYPSAAWRRSYARRTGAERGFATAKDPATNDITRGWCRLMGLAPLMLFITTLLIVRNQRIITAWEARQQESERLAARGLPPKTRRRRRKTLATLTAAPP